MSLCTEANIDLGSLPSLSPGSKERHTPVSPNLAHDQVSCLVPLFWAAFLHVLYGLGLFLFGLRAHLLFPLWCLKMLTKVSSKWEMCDILGAVSL